MTGRAAAIAAVEHAVGHTFADRALIDEALTHASVGDGALGRAAGGGRRAHNERLEFLGDRVLGLIVAEALLQRHPDDREGDLSKRLHVLVSRKVCAAVARGIDLGACLRMPGGETRRGARDQDTILADACEALIAAVYRDAGLERSRAVVLSLWTAHMDAVEAGGFANPKSELQEWAAAQGRAPPRYSLVHRVGPDHAPVFTVEAALEGSAPERAEGSSQKVAETAAALALLKREKTA